VKRYLIWTLVAIAGAGLALTSGIIPIKASSGHWRATAWVLDFAKRRSVATHSIGISVPPLDDPSMIVKGAGHYETGCRPCHGSPAVAPPLVPRRMTPHPPDLRLQVSRWEPAELFSIVKHGIKFTGMPAWPSPGRDDEVWAVVAFLRKLPRLDAMSYTAIVFGQIAPARHVHQAGEPARAAPPIASLAAARCARCHGPDGQGRDTSAFPRLAGQYEEYLRGALRAFGQGARHSGVMEPVAAELSPEQLDALAEHYARMPRQAGEGAASSAAIARGAALARSGAPAQDVPACAECHGPADGRRNPAYPALAGQPSEYLALQLRLFAEGKRGGSPYEHIMRGIAPRLTDEQREDVAAFYASSAR